MKITLISTIRGKELHTKTLETIISFLRSRKYDVFSEHLTKTSQQDLDNMSSHENLEFHENILSKIKQSDLVIAEASSPSLSVGYLISYALENGKPTIVLYNSKSPKPNLFPTLLTSDKLILSEYLSVQDIPDQLKECIASAMEQQDARFNLMIPPKMNSYLKKHSKNYGVSKASYIRSLINEKMKT